MNTEELQNILKTNDAVMVYFSGKDCGVCQALQPKIKTLFTTSFPKVKQIFIEADTFIQTAREFGIFTLPSLIIFIQNKEFVRESRHISINELETQFSRTYTMFFEE